MKNSKEDFSSIFPTSKKNHSGNSHATEEKKAAAAAAKHTKQQNNYMSRNANKKQQNISIDEKHNLLMNEFEKIESEVIPHLIEQKNHLKTKIKSLKDHQLDECLDYYDKIKKINEEIKINKNKKKKYLLDNSVFIFNYFEEKKNICGGGGGANAAETTASSASDSGKNKKILNSFFKIKTVKPAGATADDTNTNTKAGGGSGAAVAAAAAEESDLSDTIYNDKYKNSRQYWANVNNQIVNMNDFILPTDVCQKCKKGELISQEDEGILICNNCGSFIQYIVDCEKPSYKEPPSEVSYTAYLRLNHFKEILSQFQAKETTQIPDEVIEAIRNRIKKERITDMSEITYNKTRDILRKLGYNKYFEHIQYINCKFGIRPPTMSEELIETLCVLFIEIQGPWAIHCPKTRTNFFNYAYTLYQLCKLLDQTEFLPFIPMLKDETKQREQDMVWKEVCQELDWQFFPSI